MASIPSLLPLGLIFFPGSWLSYTHGPLRSISDAARFSVTEWVVWYDDATSFSNLDGLPHEAPRWGVLCVAAQCANHGRMIWQATDYYVWADGWISCDAAGLLDYLGNRPGAEKVVLIGRHVQPDVFHRVYEMANSDPRLPPKTSIDSLEQRRPQL